jgi:hypothetical protein
MSDYIMKKGSIHYLNRDISSSDAEKWNRTIDTGPFRPIIDTGPFRPIRFYFYNIGKALSIVVFSLSIKDVREIMSFDGL